MTNIYLSSDFENQAESSLGDSPIHDSGLSARAWNQQVGYSGSRSIQMMINSWYAGSGCRTFVNDHIKSGQDGVYGAWFMTPTQIGVGGWWNINQIKSKNENEDAVAYKLEVYNPGYQQMALKAVYKLGLPGPHYDDDSKTKTYFQQNPIPIVPLQWFHLEFKLVQSDNYDGQWVVKQNGIEIFRFENIITRLPNGFNSWSVNNYGSNLWTNGKTGWNSLFVDDVTVADDFVYSAS